MAMDHARRAAETADPWAGILSADERILWQGQPDTRIEWRHIRPIGIATGAVFAFVGLSVGGAGITAIGRDGFGPVVQALVGLGFAGVGLRLAVGDVLIDAYERSRTWYTLTNRRMLVAWDTFGKRQLRDEVLTPETGLILEDGDPGAVLVSGQRRIGFRRIADARMVYDLARRAQRGQA